MHELETSLLEMNRYRVLWHLKSFWNSSSDFWNKQRKSCAIKRRRQTSADTQARREDFVLNCRAMRF